MAPDAVVVATGGTRARASMPGGDLPRVADLREWLAAEPAVAPGETVTIWGADRVGLAAADALAATGTPVLLIGAQRQIAPEAGRREKILAIPRLQANPDVRIELGATLEAVEDDRILVGRDGRREWLAVRGPCSSPGHRPRGRGTARHPAAHLRRRRGGHRHLRGPGDPRRRDRGPGDR